jgi:tetratricopeptide (TPR) repeat protein
LDAYTKALQLFRDDREALGGLLETHIARGTADEAAEVLERVVEGREHDTELVSMLARAHLEAEEPKGAERATTLLMERDPTSYPQYLPVTRLYLKAGSVDDVIRILSTIIERMLAGREERELLEIVNQVLVSNPDHIGALRMLVRIHWWQRDMDALRSALERLAESAEASELIDEERYALTQLVRLAPDEQRYLDRLNLLGGLQEDTAEDLSSMPAPESVSEVPEFETFAVVDEQDEIPQPVASSFDEFETNEVPGLSSFESPAAGLSDPTASFADLNEDPSESVFPVDAPVEAERQETMMRQELESVDFYIAQGYSDIAFDTLEMLERQFGQHPEILARREKLSGGGGSTAEPAVFEFGGSEELAEATPVVEAIAFETEPSFATLVNDGDGKQSATKAAAPVGPGIDAGLAELFEEFRAAEEGDTGHEDFETHYNMGTAYKEMDLMDEAVQEFQVAASLVKPADGTSRFLQCCNMLGHCFMQKGMPEAAVIWFKKGLSAPGHTEDEYQALRYELATAYEQLGDLKNAREFYTEVYGVDVSYREVADKLSQLKNK